MNIIPNLPILHSKKTVGKFVFTQNYLQSLFKIFLDSSFILSVKIVSFPSILISKYILIAIGNPTFAIRTSKLPSIYYIKILSRS